MTRFRLTVSTEYEVHEDHYYTKDVAEMLAIDQQNAEDDPWGMLNVGDTKVKVVVEDITYAKGGVLPPGVVLTNITKEFLANRGPLVINQDDFRVDL